MIFTSHPIKHKKLPCHEWYNIVHAIEDEIPASFCFNSSRSCRRYMRALYSCVSLRLNFVLPVPNRNRFGTFCYLVGKGDPTRSSKLNSSHWAGRPYLV